MRHDLDKSIAEVASLKAQLAHERYQRESERTPRLATGAPKSSSTCNSPWAVRGWGRGRAGGAHPRARRQWKARVAAVQVEYEMELTAHPGITFDSFAVLIDTEEVKLSPTTSAPGSDLASFHPMSCEYVKMRRCISPG